MTDFANVVATRDSDPVQLDPFLVCTNCYEKLCTVEEGDTFDVLASVVTEHVCEPARVERAGRIRELRREIAEAYRLGRDPQRQLCELVSIEEE